MNYENFNTYSTHSTDMESEIFANNDSTYSSVMDDRLPCFPTEVYDDGCMPSQSGNYQTFPNDPERELQMLSLLDDLFSSLPSVSSSRASAWVDQPSVWNSPPQLSSGSTSSFGSSASPEPFIDNFSPVLTTLPPAHTTPLAPPLALHYGYSPLPSQSEGTDNRTPLRPISLPVCPPMPPVYYQPFYDQGHSTNPLSGTGPSSSLHMRLNVPPSDKENRRYLNTYLTSRLTNRQDQRQERRSELGPYYRDGMPQAQAAAPLPLLSPFTLPPLPVSKTAALQPYLSAPFYFSTLHPSQTANPQFRTKEEIEALGGTSVFCRIGACTKELTTAKAAYEHVERHGLVNRGKGGQGAGVCPWCWKDNVCLFRHIMTTHLVQVHCPFKTCQCNYSRMDALIRHLNRDHANHGLPLNHLELWAYGAIKK